jgi:hypothetical protein
MLKAGFNEADITKIGGGNFCRYLMQQLLDISENNEPLTKVLAKGWADGKSIGSFSLSNFSPGMTSNAEL